MRFRSSIQWAALAGLALAVASPLAAQSPVHPGYPNVNRQISIASGESITLLNRVMFDRGPGVRSGRRLDFQIRTSIPAGDAAAREALAERLAQHFGAQAIDAGVRLLSVAICDTDACAKRDEPPRTWFIYELKSGNVWKPVKP
jgi:hypothetical protein